MILFGFPKIKDFLGGFGGFAVIRKKKLGTKRFRFEAKYWGF